MSRNCSCGCDTFRFKFDCEEGITFNNSICSNCNHTLVEHTNLVKKQAE